MSHVSHETRDKEPHTTHLTRDDAGRDSRERHRAERTKKHARKKHTRERSTRERSTLHTRKKHARKKHTRKKHTRKKHTRKKHRHTKKKDIGEKQYPGPEQRRRPRGERAGSAGTSQKRRTKAAARAGRGLPARSFGRSSAKDRKSLDPTERKKRKRVKR